MKDGFIKCAAATFSVTVANPQKNAEEIINIIDAAENEGVNVVTFPELCLTGYTCADLFYHETLLNSAKSELERIAHYTEGKFPVIIVGLPIKCDFKLYNCAAVIFNGEILGLVPKTYLPNHGEFFEKRQFASAFDLPKECYNTVDICGEPVVIDSRIIFKNSNYDDFRIGVEICEDLWAADTPSNLLCRSGATIIVNPAASTEAVGKSEYRKMLVKSASAKLACGYVFAGAGMGESTQDAVFSGHCIIAENGKILAENPPFEDNRLLITEIDLERIRYDRHRTTSFPSSRAEGYSDILFDQPLRETKLTRNIARNPFVPDNRVETQQRAAEILKMQSFALKKRIEHSGAEKLVIGISGGLDSCLALLVCTRAMDILGRDRGDIIAVTMPCFGTTSRTRSNAEKLCELLGVGFKEINIAKSVVQHFEDIDHDRDNLDVTYENAQARERTQVLMDIANMTGGIVVGTGDLSEAALGWSTYNGDHMSMYGVNAGVPKTLIRHIVKYEASETGGELEKVLLDILDTPVSPELLPADDKGNINQKTEDLVGPYQLHDFFLYYFVRFGFSPLKVLRLAKNAYSGVYSDEIILKWLRVFIKRFFTQQFKRSCTPDGVKVGTVALSPRGDWRMPSDASYQSFIKQLENL